MTSVVPRGSSRDPHMKSLHDLHPGKHCQSGADMDRIFCDEALQYPHSSIASSLRESDRNKEMVSECTSRYLPTILHHKDRLNMMREILLRHGTSIRNRPLERHQKTLASFSVLFCRQPIKVQADVTTHFGLICHDHTTTFLGPRHQLCPRCHKYSSERPSCKNAQNLGARMCIHREPCISPQRRAFGPPPLRCQTLSMPMSNLLIHRLSETDRQKEPRKLTRRQPR